MGMRGWGGVLVIAALGGAVVTPGAAARGPHLYDLRFDDAVQSTTRVPGGGVATGTYRSRIVVPVDRRGGGGVALRRSGRAGGLYHTTYRGRFRGRYDVGAGRCAYSVGGTVRGGLSWRPSGGLQLAPSVARFPGSRRSDDACANPRTGDPYVFFTVEAAGYRSCVENATRKAAAGVRGYRCSYTFEAVRFHRLARGTARVTEKRSGKVELTRVSRRGAG